jgi:hypothetical protein
MSRRDIIRWSIDWLLANDAAFTEELALLYERDARAEWGGVENRPWKTQRGQVGRPPARPYDPVKAYTDALSDAPTEAVTTRHGVSRATLYRLVKRGPRKA